MTARQILIAAMCAVAMTASSGVSVARASKVPEWVDAKLLPKCSRECTDMIRCDRKQLAFEKMTLRQCLMWRQECTESCAAK